MKKLFGLMLLGASACGPSPEEAARIAHESRCVMPAYCERQGYKEAVSNSGQRYCVGGDKPFWDFVCANSVGEPRRTCPARDPYCIDRPKPRPGLPPGIVDI